ERRRAAARRRGAGAGQRSRADPRRRADRQPRFGQRLGDRQPAEVPGHRVRQDGDHGEPRSEDRRSLPDRVRDARRPVPGQRDPRGQGRMTRAAAVAFALLGLAAPALGQSRPVYVPFTPGAVKGVLYTPDSGPAPHVAVLLIHRTSNFLAHLATTELAARGFMVLAMNPRSDNNEAAVSFEDNALDIKSGIEFLRKQPGITKVLLFGHSGGGPATSFYP